MNPPAPFHGSGAFRRNPDGSINWSGSLSIAFPGLGRVDLTRGHAELATVATHLKQLEEEFESKVRGR